VHIFKDWSVVSNILPFWFVTFTWKC